MVEKKLNKLRLFLKELEKSTIFLHIEARQHLHRREDSIKIVKRIRIKSQNVPTGSALNTSLCIKCTRCKFCRSNNGNKTEIAIINKHISKCHKIYNYPICNQM